MKTFLTLALYRLLLPVLFIIAFPGWVSKMIKRGGFGSGLLERVGIYKGRNSEKNHEAIHLHAVSVGETIIALKLLREWQGQFPEQKFILATGTATGHQTATKAHLKNVCITYAPLDFVWMVRSYFKQFSPARIILIEGEIWPNLLRIAEKKNVPVLLANARTSPRSTARMIKFSGLLKPFFSKLTAVCIQEETDRTLWETLGISQEKIHLTGSIKFDSKTASAPQANPEFESMLQKFGPARPVILAASTFPGEEELIVAAIRAADKQALPVIVPRHAERRNEVKTSLQAAGHTVILRSRFPTDPDQSAVFVIDSTGELAQWTASADVVIIGKSFIEKGGQNPAEAIAANKPLILGPNMQNFQPLAQRLIRDNAALAASNIPEISQAIRQTLNPDTAKIQTSKAREILSSHDGATLRHLKALHP